MKQDRRLGVAGRLQLGLGSVHYEPPQRHREPRLGLSDEVGRARVPLQQVAGHSNELGALAWKQEGDGDR